MISSGGLKNNTQGFTLIELLTVVAIIGVLATITTVVVNDARNKAKVSQIKSDMVQIRNAAELYRNNTGNYPTSFSVLVPDYLPKLPNNQFSFAVSSLAQAGGGLQIGGGGWGGNPPLGGGTFPLNPLPGGGLTGGLTIPVSSGSGYSMGTESTSNYCGASTALSEVEAGKFYVYSNKNVGAKNVGFFTKFKVELETLPPGVSGPLNILLRNTEPSVYPCLE